MLARIINYTEFTSHCFYLTWKFSSMRLLGWTNILWSIQGSSNHTLPPSTCRYFGMVLQFKRYLIIINNPWESVLWILQGKVNLYFIQKAQCTRMFFSLGKSCLALWFLTLHIFSWSCGSTNNKTSKFDMHLLTLICNGVLHLMSIL